MNMLPIHIASIGSTIPPFLGVKLLCVLIVEFNIIYAQGQGFSPSDKLHFEHLGADQGIPQTWVRAICQDKEGFMWIGTHEGLFKYDGHRATRFVYNPALPAQSLRSGIIRAVHEDGKGNLWVASFGGGLHQIDKRRGKITVYSMDAKHSVKWQYINSMYQDAGGILWLGTEQGIARFNPDTRTYTLYPTPNGGFIETLKGDDTGKLWSGSYRFDPATGKFTLFTLPTSFEGQLVSPLAFHIDAEGIAWMGTWEDGLFHIDTHKPEKYTLYNPKGLINKSINSIYTAEGYMWLATTEGLQRVELRTDQVITYHADPSKPGSLNTDMLGSGLYKDRSGNLWVGTADGLTKTSLYNKNFAAYQIFPTHPSFDQPGNAISSILEDHTGTIWVGSSSKGLYRMNSEKDYFIQVIVNPNDNRVKLSFQTWPLLEDHQGGLWVGTDMEKGLYRLDRSTGKFTRYACEFHVRSLDIDASGKLWIGCMEEIACFDPLTKKFTYFKSDEKEATSLMPGKNQDLMVSRNGEVWVATRNGISRLNQTTGQFTRYQPNSRAPRGHLNDSHVLTLYEDHEGIVWIGTFQGGLNRYDPNTNVFTHFTTEHGLPGNQVQSIIEDGNGNLWIGTNQGLSRFHLKTNTFRNFDISDGLLDNQFLRTSVYQRNGKMLFGNRDGLVAFFPDSIKEDYSTFPVYITGLKVLEENKPLKGDSLELSYEENFISLTFAALNYVSPKKTRYAYKLEGVDRKWVYTGSQTVARYTNVSPGRYFFRVKATTDPDGRVWQSKQASLTITIHPPFWKTWWAYGFYGLCFLAGIFAVDRFQRHRLMQREQQKTRERELAHAWEIEKANKDLAHQKEELQSTLEHLKATQNQLVEQEKAGLENALKLERAAYQSRTVELEMQALRAQMNPHFIFNCLNSINRFMLKNEPEAASDYLTKFSKLIRLILHNSQSKAVSLEHELEALRLYLDMEMLRFEGQFTYRISLAPHLEVEDLEVPPLIIQPYVENAIWHGLMHKQGKGQLELELGRENGTLYCQITDDGVGRKRAIELKSKTAGRNKSLGMQITAHRLELINTMSEKATTVEVIDLVDMQGEACGTTVVVKIPV